MPKLPQIKPRQIEKVLLKLGFAKRHGKGSHNVFAHPDGRRTVVPVHAKPIKIGTLNAMLRQINITPNEFLSLLKN